MGLSQSSLSGNAGFNEGKTVEAVPSNAIKVNVVKVPSPAVKVNSAVNAKANTVASAPSSNVKADGKSEMVGGSKGKGKKKSGKKDKKVKAVKKGLENKTVEELIKRAAKLKIKGRHDMKKGKLVKAIREKNK